MTTLARVLAGSWADDDQQRLDQFLNEENTVSQPRATEYVKYQDSRPVDRLVICGDCEMGYEDGELDEYEAIGGADECQFCDLED